MQQLPRFVKTIALCALFGLATGCGGSSSGQRQGQTERSETVGIWPDSYSPGFPPPQSVPFPEPSYPNRTNCDIANSLANSGLPASSDIQRCIDSSPAGSQILLNPGVYILESGLVLNKPLYLGTRGQGSQNGVPCDVGDMGSCAVLKLSIPFETAKNGPHAHGVIHIASSRVSIDHLVIDGDAKNPARNTAVLCKGDVRHPLTYSVSLDGSSDFTMTNSVIRNTPCGTGFEVSPPATGFRFVRNTVAHNGTHNISMHWADGLTVLGASDAIVEDNLFLNNTDVDLIFGACTDCNIRRNRIYHDDLFAHSSFAALMLHAWPGGSGDYTGSETSQNQVDCGPKRRCGIGLYIGADAWYAAPTLGGTYRHNRILNAQQGISVDQATGPIVLYDNFVANSGGRFLSACGVTDYGQFNISPESLPFVDLSLSAASPLVTQVSYDGCIPNWWEKDGFSEAATKNVLPGAPIPISGDVPPGPDRLLPGQTLLPGEFLRSIDGRFELHHQADGNLVIYFGAAVLWSSGTAGTATASAQMQGDGNFTLTDVAGAPLFFSATAGNPGAYLVMQSDGNLVVYGPDRTPLWDTGTHGN